MLRNTPDGARSRRARRPSMASREAVLGLDTLERKLSVTLALIALGFGIFFFVQWVTNAKIVKTAAPLVHHACAHGYHFVASSGLCQQSSYNRGAWLLQFIVVVVLGLAILYTAWRKKRAGVATFALLLGLFLGVAGLGVVFFFFGAWLMLRAYRLQKYGDATWKGSNRVAREMAEARRSGRAARGGTTTATSTEVVAPPRTAAPPPPSKRYTPKKQSRRR
ncbi:MAG: hypothetical protein ACYCPK_05540 [Acidimicrobiales bacterium]